MKTVHISQQPGEHPLQISRIALGCDHFGMRIPQAEAFRIMDAYFSLGGNVLDTAHVYCQKDTASPSISEITVGKWIAANQLQGQVIVSSKGAHPGRENMQVSRIDPQSIRGDLESSLEALQTDSIDIWFLHRDNPAMPVQEIVDIVSAYAEKGWIQRLGVSNWKADRIREANAYAQAHGKRGFAISQIQWSLAVTTPEDWDDPTIVCMNETEYAWYQANRFPVMCYSSQAKGMFSKIIEGRMDSVPPKIQRHLFSPENLARVERCRTLCRTRGSNAAGVCLAYLAGAPFPVIPIVGCSSATQLKDTLHDADIVLQPDEMDFLNGVPAVPLPV